MLVAAVEHAARTFIEAVTRAVAVKLSGYKDYEAGDYFDADRWLLPPVDRASLKTVDISTQFTELIRERFVDQEAEQEVSEPVGGAFIFGYNEGLPLPNLCNGFGSAPSSAAAWCACGHWLHPGNVCHCGCTNPRLSQSPVAGQRGENPAGVTPPTPAGSSTVQCSGPERYTLDEWIAWATPAIVDVLSEHRTSGGTFVDGTAGKVNCITFTSVHTVCDNWQAWREHVAPFIAARIKADATQADRPNAFEAVGTNAGQIFAAEFYEQHKK